MIPNGNRIHLLKDVDQSTGISGILTNKEQSSRQYGMEVPLKKIATATLVVGLVTHATAYAETKVSFDPMTLPGGNIRYEQGVPRVDVEKTNGAVQITPLGLDHGRLTFDVAVLNLSDDPDNFGIEDIRVQVDGRDYAVLSAERLDKMARNRARWAQFGMALAAGMAAGAAASARDTYTATTYTPRGTYYTHMSAPSISGQIAANNISRDGAYAIAGIQARLDATRAAIADEIVQTTTVDPQRSYGGRIVVDKIKAKWPYVVNLTVRLADELYEFAFKVSKR